MHGVTKIHMGERSFKRQDSGMDISSTEEEFIGLVSDFTTQPIFKKLPLPSFGIASGFNTESKNTTMI
jgi:hypothetical protein